MSRVALLYQNWITDSEVFAGWILSNVTTADNARTAPDGNTTACDITEGNGSSSHQFAKNITLTSSLNNSDIYTMSIYALAGTRTWLMGLSMTGAYVTSFDLGNGVLGTAASGAGVSNSITAVGGGWYLCTVSAPSGGTGLKQFGWRLETGNGASVYQGDSVSKLSVWGAQVNMGALVTPYRATSGAAQTVAGRRKAANRVVVANRAAVTGRVAP